MAHHPPSLNVSLSVKDGKHKDCEIPLPPTMFVIGRDPRCHLRPHCKSVSRRHCAIVTWIGRVLVRDFNSANGTYVNDQRVHGEVVVREGDTLRVGSLLFSIRVRPTTTAAAPSKSDVQWLLDTPLESQDLHLGSDTSCEIPIEHAASEVESTAEPSVRSEKKRTEMSAGQFLRDFFSK